VAAYFSLLFLVTAEYLGHFHLSHLSLEAGWIYGLILQKLPLLGELDSKGSVDVWSIFLLFDKLYFLQVKLDLGKHSMS